MILAWASPFNKPKCLNFFKPEYLKSEFFDLVPYVIRETIYTNIFGSEKLPQDGEMNAMRMPSRHRIRN